MNASDLDDHSFVLLRHKTMVIGIKAHCLPGLKGRLLIRRAWLDTQPRQL